MLIKLYSKNNSQRDLDRILDVLNGGGIIICPTDTAYAIGCHALKERPIERICKIKGINPQKHRFSIICYDLSKISQYVQIDNSTVLSHLYCVPETDCLKSSATEKR